MWLWEIIVEAWPFSTGVGQEEDQKACGPRSVPCHERCSNIEQAMKYAKTVSKALKRNPRVWQAPITSIRQLSHIEAAEIMSRGG